MPTLHPSTKQNAEQLLTSDAMSDIADAAVRVIQALHPHRRVSIDDARSEVLYVAASLRFGLGSEDVYLCAVALTRETGLGILKLSVLAAQWPSHL